jgi:WD40 repeat protein
VATGRLLFTAHPPASTAWCVAFSPDGKTLVTAASSGGSTTSTGTMRLWNVASLDDVASSLCASAGRTMTRAEWALYVQGPAYQNLCP